MKNLKTKILIGIITIFFLPSGCVASSDRNETRIKKAARQASVQPIFVHEMLLVEFAHPVVVPVPKKPRQITAKEIQSMIRESLEGQTTTGDIQNLIQKALDEKAKERTANKYGRMATDKEVYGHKPHSSVMVYLQSLLPPYSRLPEKIVVVYEVGKKEITAYEEKYEDDVKTFSELANVSIPTAKTIISSLSGKGYTISKDEIAKDSKVKLLWYDDGWDDKYPQTLGWEVFLEGKKDNLIKGYINGMLEISPIPDDARVYVKFSHQEMFKSYIPDTPEAKKLKAEKKDAEDRLKKLREDLEKEKTAVKDLLEEKIKKLEQDIKDAADKAAKEAKKKRDIRDATWMDVKYGNVKIKTIYGQSGGSGIFLGNMRVRREFWGNANNYYSLQRTEPRDKAVILTNAHVAANAFEFNTYVSEDLERMLLVYPGWPFIRYTSQSDMYGSPAHILSRDGKAIMSSDFDCAIMVTTAVPHMERYKAILGNSDRVQEGLSIVSVGNPLGLQKFTSVGVVSRTDYDILKSDIADYILKHITNRGRLNGLLNANFWVDTPIGAGGISGSGIWALEGSEAGKVIALNSFGMMASTNNKFTFSAGKEVDPRAIYFSDSDPQSYGYIKDTAKDYVKRLFKHESYRDASFSVPMEAFKEDYPSIVKQLHGGAASVPGVHGGIPINKIKLFLQESGLDPESFGWEKASGRYWTK